MSLLVLVAWVPAAHATLTVRITENGGPPITCTGTVTVVCSSAPGAAYAFDIQVGTSNSPGPAQITITSTVHPNMAGDTLKVETSDTNFLIPVGPATLVQTLNTNTAAVVSATGSIVGVGGFSNANTLFCVASSTCTAVTPSITFNSFLVGNSSTSSVPGTFIAPFSMDEQLNFTFTSAGTALQTATLSAIQVPEPASVAMLGGALLFIAGAIRRKTKRA